MATSRSHTYRLGVNCQQRGLDENQADDFIRQFAAVLHPHAWDDFWVGYYGSVMQADHEAEPQPTDIAASFTGNFFAQSSEGVWR